MQTWIQRLDANVRAPGRPVQMIAQRHMTVDHLTKLPCVSLSVRFSHTQAKNRPTSKHTTRMMNHFSFIKGIPVINRRNEGFLDGTSAQPAV